MKSGTKHYAEYYRKRYAKRRELGLCGNCGVRKAKKDATRCTYCLKKMGDTRWRNTWYKYAYGISIMEYNVLLKQQHSTCAICRKKQKSKRLAVDHLGKKIRGLLCVSCNTALGLLKEDETIIGSALAYLRRANSKDGAIG